jgi:4-hydroxy-2-oxoheptanedioate aldolase
MITENRTRTKLKNGQPVFGLISSSADPLLAELAGLAGFDYFMLDAEHGPLTPAQAVNVVRACETVGLTPLVRVGSKDPKLVLQYLDAGMLGIMMPGLMTPDEVRALVAAVKYPLLGERGLGLARAAGYAPTAAYVEFAVVGEK